MTEEFTDRQKVAEILKLVRIGHLSVRDGLLSYPKDTDDDSLIAAYHALIHYEADEDLRYRDALYREEQDDYLEFLSYILERNEDLPENIITNYKQYYDSAPILHKNNFKGFLKGFWKILNISSRRKK